MVQWATPFSIGKGPVPRSRLDLPDYVLMNLLAVPMLLAASAWLLEFGSLDMWIARQFVDASGAAGQLEHSVWLNVLGHQAARFVPVLVGVLAITGGFVPRLRQWRPILLATGISVILGPALINAMKTVTSQHCPAQILELGGVVSYAADQAAPFWAVTKARAGHCLPSGHAGGGYALLALYFAGWAAGRPSWRWGGLLIGVTFGLLFSVVRMMQGAHFASATLWSATIDWIVCALCFMPLIAGQEKPV
jgi:membrane-associated PAP2 superfamily phosphatase